MVSRYLLLAARKKNKEKENTMDMFSLASPPLAYFPKSTSQTRVMEEWFPEDEAAF